MNKKMVFNLQANGYSPEQVDRYIEKLSDEYTSLHSMYTHVTGEYTKLAEEIMRLQNTNNELTAEISQLWERNESLHRTVNDVRSGLRLLFQDSPLTADLEGGSTNDENARRNQS